MSRRRHRAHRRGPGLVAMREALQEHPTGHATMAPSTHEGTPLPKGGSEVSSDPPTRVTWLGLAEGGDPPCGRRVARFWTGDTASGRRVRCCAHGYRVAASRRHWPRCVRAAGGDELRDRGRDRDVRPRRWGDPAGGAAERHVADDGDPGPRGPAERRQRVAGVADARRCAASGAAVVPARQPRRRRARQPVRRRAADALAVARAGGVPAVERVGAGALEAGAAAVAVRDRRRAELVPDDVRRGDRAGAGGLPVAGSLRQGRHRGRRTARA